MIPTYIKEVEIDGIKEPRLYTDIINLTEWAKNKELRITGPDGFRRVKEQITDLKQYKPLLVLSTGVVIAGNTRLKAFRELGINEVYISILNPRDENDLLKFNLSDNDNVSLYNPDGLANLLSEYDLNLEDYAVDFDEPITLADIVPGTDSNISANPTPSDPLVKCPNCGHEFSPSKT